MRNKMADICQASCGEWFFFSLLDSLIRLEPEVIHLCLEERIILGIADGKAEERLLRENKLALNPFLSKRFPLTSKIVWR